MSKLFVKPLMQIQLSGVNRMSVVPQDCEHCRGEPVAEVSKVITEDPSAWIRPGRTRKPPRLTSESRKQPWLTGTQDGDDTVEEAKVVVGTVEYGKLEVPEKVKREAACEEEI